MVLADSITVTERIVRLGNRQTVKEEDFAGWAVKYSFIEKLKLLSYRDSL
jgi:hypothetical protein